MTTPTDNTPADLPELTERQQTILSLIVREYVENGQPVGSKTLVERFELGYSSATVRNEMGALEQAGLIYAPHTSAGRVPTQRGYRYFVRHLLKGGALTGTERRRITQQMRQMLDSMDEWPRMAAMLLAQTTRTAALVTPPLALESHFKHVELISTQGRLVLMVLVVQGGSVHQEVLTLTEAVPQTQLSHTAALINGACVGLTPDQVRVKTRNMGDLLAREVGELAADAMRASQQVARDVYGYGLSENLPAFTDDAAQQAVRVMEEGSLLDGVLGEVITADASDIQILVGGEGRWEDLSHLSMVLGRYGTTQARGALGVLGPTRMRYGRAISAVRYLAGLMSEMLGDVYREGDGPPPRDPPRQG